MCYDEVLEVDPGYESALLKKAAVNFVYSKKIMAKSQAAGVCVFRLEIILKHCCRKS